MNKFRFLGLAAALLLFLAAEARAGSVTGRLVDDAGKPVAGAKVTWEAFRSDEERLVAATRGSDPTPLGETATDPEGRFRVVLDKPGSLTSIRIATTGPSVFLEGPFEAAETTDLEEIQLPASEKLSGRVTDEAGKPVGGARVRVTGGQFSEEGTDFYSVTLTGADGSFAFAIPQDQRLLTVRAVGYAPFERFRGERRTSEKVTLKLGGTVKGIVLDKDGQPAARAIVVVGDLAAQTDATGAYRIDGVAAGSRTVEALWKEDFAARQDVVRVKKGAEAEASLRLARAASITGNVIEEKTRKPVPGAVVRASVGGPGFRMGRQDTVVRRARTDARGRFRIAGLGNRRYTVAASRDGFLPASISGVTAGVQSPGSASLALARAATVSGRVTTEDGKAVHGARVRIAGDSRGPMAILNMRSPLDSMFRDQGARSRPDGTFRLRNLAAGKNLSLEASSPGHVTAMKHGVTFKSGDVVRDVVLVLKKGLEARGRVVEAQGQPIAGAEVRVSPPEGAGMAGVRIVSSVLGRTEKPDAVSGGDGGFRVVGLEEGEFQVSVRRDGYASKTFSSMPVQAKGPNEWQPFVLALAVSVSGFVRDADGVPVPAARVASFGEGAGVREDTTGPDGSFRLEGFTADRQAMVTASAEGFAWLQRQVTAPASDLVLVMKKSAVLRGRVEDAATKRPLTEFSVGYFPQRAGGFAMRFGGPNERPFQSSDGSFEMADVQPGKWSLRASAPGYRSADVSVEVAEGETKEGLVISLKQGGILTGRVLDPRRGGGVPNATVVWQDSASEAPNRAMAAMVSRMSGGETSTFTDADGRFRFEGLPEGKVALTATHAEFLEVTKEIDADAETNVDLTLSLGGSIAGTVVGKDGRTPVAGAEVNLNELGSGGPGWGGDASRTDGSGNFLFEHLKPGRFRVSARAVVGKAPAREVVLADSQRLDGVLLAIASGTTVRGTVTGLPANRLGQVRVGASAKDYSDSTLTDDSGRFTFRDVPAGSLRLSGSTEMMSRRSTFKSFEVPEGADEFPVELPFEGSSRLSGRVTRAGRPLGGLFINANPDPPSPTGGRGSGQTDENGAYTIEGLADGNYQVFVYGSGVSYRKTFPVSGDSSGDIELPAVSVSGFVTDAATGEPIEGAGVRAETGRETATFAMRQAMTDSRGFFSLDDLDLGSYKITARKDSYQPKEQTVSVGSSSSELTLALQRGVGLPIRAVDGITGLPLRGLFASIFASQGGVAYSGSVSLDSEGKGEISSIGAGNYRLHLFSDGYAPRTVTAVAVPGAPLAVALTPGGRVEVRSDGPVSGRIVDGAGTAYMLNPYRTDGRVNPAPPLTVWENFAPGTYQLLVTTSTGEKSYPFTVTEGRTTTVEVR